MSRPLDYLAPPDPTDHINPRWLSAILLALAAVSVGYAIHIRDGEYIPEALKWVTISLILCAAGVALPLVHDRTGWGVRAVVPVVALAVLFQFYQLFRSPPGGWNWWSDDLVGMTRERLRPYYAGVLAAAVFAAGLLSRQRRLRLVCLLLLLATHFLLGVWMIRSAPTPHIDVFIFQQVGPRALLDGQNPYTIEFPDIYHGTAQEQDRVVYGQGLSQQGKLKFGFPYPPLSLYLATLGYAAAGDHRYAQLAAMTLSGLMIAFSRPGRLAALAAALLLFTPRGFFILGRAWTEPLVVLTLAATVFCACRGLKRSLPVALGLLLGIKQYLIFSIPAAVLITPRPLTARRAILFLLQAVAVAALVSAPLVLWDFHAFYHSAAYVQKVAPFREDALSYLVWIYHQHGVQPGLWLAFVAMLAGMALGLCRSPRDPSGFAATLAMTYLPFIAFNKQAFANYYYFVIGALCCAVAAIPWESAPRPPGVSSGEPSNGLKSEPGDVR